MTINEVEKRAIALLGATGKTGLVLQQQLAQERYHLQVYARSQERLLEMFPSLDKASNVKIYTGPITNMALIRDCLSSAKTIICTLGTTGWQPDTILQDSARSMMQALS
jgi:short subunit dehydrogenase-like uncharacterized protein